MISKIQKLISLILFIFLAASCSQDETNYQSAFCVVMERGDQSLYLRSDEGVDLNTSTALDASTYKAGQRYRVTYITMVNGKINKEEQTIEVVDMLPVKILRSISIQEYQKQVNSTGSGDPVWLNVTPWASGGFLNLEFTFGYKNPDIQHSVYMVRDSMVRSNESDNLYLSFRYDANKDESSILTSAFASILLDSISLPGIQFADSLIIHVQEGVQQKDYKLAAIKDFQIGN